VVADQRLGGLQFLGQVGDTQLLGAEQLNDPPAQGSPSARASSTGNASGLAARAAGATVVAIGIKVG
jgi:hypothetical protein